MLDGQFFDLNTSSVCSKMSSLEDSRKHSVLTSCDENSGIDDEDERSSQSIVCLSLHLVAFFKHLYNNNKKITLCQDQG